MKKKTKITIGISAAGVILIAGILISTPKILKNSKLKKFEKKASETTLEIALNEFYPITDEEFEKASPQNKEKAAYIDNLPKFDKNDTWVIYMYLVGTNLESYNNNALSDLSCLLLNQYAIEKEEDPNGYRAITFDLYNELFKNNMDFPNCVYKQDYSYKNPVQKTSNRLEKGIASCDFMDITRAKLPENIKFIIQTGGAKKWDFPGANANRIQRWMVSSKGVEEIYNGNLENMGSPEGVISFLNFANQYEADHKAFFFWDHGGASFGAEHDELFDSMLSNKDIRNAFDAVYDLDLDNPPFELFGFDCCLMSCAEGFEQFAGIAKYFVGSVEVENDGWKYTEWVPEFAKHPEMNGAQLGKLIADTFAKKAVQIGKTETSPVNVLGVYDLSKGANIYSEYRLLAEEMLEDVVNDPSVLTYISKASDDSLKMCYDGYAIYNTCDMGMFMENIKSKYPRAQTIINMINECNLYQRGLGRNIDTTGVTIYYPSTINELYSMYKCINYINTIADSDAINALYFYKITGCLTDKNIEYLTSKGYDIPPVIDTAYMKDFETYPATLKDNGNFEMNIPEELLKYVQNVSYQLVKYDEKENAFTYFGEDAFIGIDDNGILSTDFEGKWVSLNNVFLNVEEIEKNKKSVIYKSPVLLNGEKKALMLNYDFETNKFSILGIRSTGEENIIGSKETIILKKGDIIVPLYKQTKGIWVEESEIQGKKIKYNPSNYKIDDKKLDNGKYYVMALFKDIKGNEYNGPVITFDVNNGKIGKSSISDNTRTINK